MLGDFSIMKNLNKINYSDNFEGDFKYLANEILYMSDQNSKTIDFKMADIFALGVSLVDILTRKIIRRALAG